MVRDLNYCQECGKRFYDALTGERLLRMRPDTYVCVECRPEEEEA